MNSHATEQDLKRIIFGAYILLGPNGQKWIKKASNKDNTYSADGALYKSAEKLKFTPDVAEITYSYLSKIVTEFGYPAASLVMYNDDPKTVFSNIKEIFDIGISRLKAR